MNSHEPTVIDYGVDYITVTATHKPKSLTLADVAREHLQAEAEAGNEISEWKGLGYHGWNCGGVSFGVGPQGTLARMTSQTARQHWRELYTWGSKCTRLDLQVTIKQRCSVTDVLQKHWKEVLEWWMDHQTRKEPEAKLGPNGIVLFRVGSRQSEQCGRVYDKGYESKLDYYRDAARYEAEFKGLRSNGLARALMGQKRDFAVINSHVSGFFRKHRVEIPIAACEQLRILLPRVESDVARKLRYISKCVGPMASFLVSQGKLDQLVEALQIAPFVTINKRSHQQDQGDSEKG